MRGPDATARQEYASSGAVCAAVSLAIPCLHLRDPADVPNHSLGRDRFHAPHLFAGAVKGDDGVGITYFTPTATTPEPRNIGLCCAGLFVLG